MNYIKLEPKYYEAWDKFALRNHWFWHTTHWIEYITHRKFGVEFKDHSFFIENSRQITNIVPLIQEGDKLISPGFDEEREIMREVKRIALDNGIKHIQVDCDIKKYLNVQNYTCVLDLNNIKPTKGHKSAIKKAEQFLTYRTSENIEKFRKYYINVAKKETRPKETFKLLGQWIKQGFGTLLEALLDGKTVGYIYVLHWNKYAYYFMSCTPRTYKQYNVTHFLMNKVFEILRNKGIEKLEMGEQVFNSLHQNSIEKERAISKFKRSFGGQIIVKPSSEYFLDQNYMIDVFANRIHKYWECEHEKNIIDFS